MRMLNIFYPDLVALINTARGFVLAAQKETEDEEVRGIGRGRQRVRELEGGCCCCCGNASQRQKLSGNEVRT